MSNANETKYYVMNGEKCLLEGMTKEQIFAAIAEATGNVPTGIDAAFITKIKEQNANATLKFWVGTRAQYNDITTPEADTLYLIVNNGLVDLTTDDVEVIKSKIPTEASAFNQLADKAFVNTLVGPNTSDINTIKGKIPTQASAQNQLTDKDFVNSSIATNTANYISDNGQPFTSLAALQAYSGTVTNNDYAFVTGTDASGNTYYDRYKATVNGATVTWALEYRLNNSSFTAAQWAAISSGITAQKVAEIDLKYSASNPQPSVAEATHAATADAATNAANATNVTSQINGKSISSIFESDGTTVKNASNATHAGRANNVNYHYGVSSVYQDLNTALLALVYPIGSIFMSTVDTNPGTYLGGTWVAWGAGRVPVGVDTSQTEFDTVEETGGEKTHTLTYAEMPSHKHGYVKGNNPDYGYQGVGSLQYAGYVGAEASTSYSGGDAPHNNLQPYITCYMFKRTA